MTTPPTPPELLVLASRLADEASQELLDELDKPHIATNKSSSTDWVTEVDAAVEARLVSRIRDDRPADAILGEEGAALTGTSGVSWIIDPIDGTSNFMNGHPGFTVSIAVAIDDITVVGVVADPMLGDLFSATAGGGAFRNGNPISVAREVAFDSALIATGFSYDRARRVGQAAIAAELLQRVGDLRRVGSAAGDLCSVACGRVAGYYEHGLSPWDFAAGTLIAAEAGAVVSGPGGGPASTELVIAAAPSIATDLVAIVDQPIPRLG